MNPSNLSSSVAWKCPCGRVVKGNGGKSSHQRICETYHRTQIGASERNIARWEAEPGNRGVDIRNARRNIVEHQAALDAIVTQRAADREAQLTPAQRADDADAFGAVVTASVADPPAAAEG